jgi:hypothetical protein
LPRRTFAQKDVRLSRTHLPRRTFAQKDICPSFAHRDICPEDEKCYVDCLQYHVYLIYETV